MRWPRRWGARPSDVLAPASVGVVLCALAVLGLRVQAGKVTDFAAHSASTTAVIDRIYDGAPHPSEMGAPWFDEYATVRYLAQRRAVHTDIRLVAGCTGTCLPAFRIGQRLRVAYDTRRVDFAVFPVPRGGPSANPLEWNPLVLFAAAGGIGALIVAAFNMGLGIRRL